MRVTIDVSKEVEVTGKIVDEVSSSIEVRVSRSVWAVIIVSKSVREVETTSVEVSVSCDVWIDRDEAIAVRVVVVGIRIVDDPR